MYKDGHQVEDQRAETICMFNNREPDDTIQWFTELCPLSHLDSSIYGVGKLK